MTDHAPDANITAGSQQASFTVRHAVIDLMRRFGITDGDYRRWCIAVAVDAWDHDDERDVCHDAGQVSHSKTGIE